MTSSTPCTETKDERLALPLGLLSWRSLPMPVMPFAFVKKLGDLR